MIAVFLVVFNFLLANFDDRAVCRHHSLLAFCDFFVFAYENAKSDESSLPLLLVAVGMINRFVKEKKISTKLRLGFANAVDLSSRLEKLCKSLHSLAYFST